MNAIFKKITISLLSIFVGLGIASIAASPAHAAALCTFNQTMTFTPPSVSTGTEIFANETGKWKLSVTGTGTYKKKANKETWVENWTPSSAGNKTVTYEKIINWTGTDGSECQSTVTFSRTYKVYAAVEPTITFLNQGSRPKFMKDTTLKFSISAKTSDGLIIIPVNGEIRTLRFEERDVNLGPIQVGNSIGSKEINSAREYFDVQTLWRKPNVGDKPLTTSQETGLNSIKYLTFVSSIPTRVNNAILNWDAKTPPSFSFFYFKQPAPTPQQDGMTWAESGEYNYKAGWEKNAGGVQYTQWKYRGKDEITVTDFTKLKYISRHEGLGPDTPGDTDERSVWWAVNQVAEREHSRYAIKYYWGLKCPPEATGVYIKAYDMGQSTYTLTTEYASMAKFNQFYYQLDRWYWYESEPYTTLFSNWSTSDVGNDNWHTVSLPINTTGKKTNNPHYFVGTNEENVYDNWACAYNGSKDPDDRGKPNPKITPIITFDIKPTYKGQRVFTTDQAIPLVDISVKHPNKPNRKVRTTPFLTIEAKNVDTSTKFTQETYCHNTGVKCAQEMFRILPVGTYDVLVRWKPDTKYDNNQIFKQATSNTIRIQVVQPFECRFTNSGAESVWIKFYDFETKKWITTKGDAQTIVRSGEEIFVGYPRIDKDDYVGIIKNVPMEQPELIGQIRAVTRIYGGPDGNAQGTPKEPDEVRLFQLNLMELVNSGSPTYTFGSYEVLGTWEVLGTRWTNETNGQRPTDEKLNDILKVFWPSTANSAGERTPFALERSIEIYGVAWIQYPDGTLEYFEGWHNCGADNPRSGNMTIISGQVNQ